MTDEIPLDGDADQVQEVRQSDHGVTIETKLKRGTGTRDQDKHTVKAKGATFEEAAYYHRQAMAYLTGDAPGDEAIADLSRRVQPDAGGDD